MQSSCITLYMHISTLKIRILRESTSALFRLLCCTINKVTSDRQEWGIEGFYPDSDRATLGSVNLYCDSIISSSRSN